MTRADAEAEVRKISRRCKGPKILTPQDEFIFYRLIEQCILSPAAKYQLDTVLLSRKGCGANFNDEICAHPFDGEERKYKCPKCGLEGTFRSPKYDLEAEDGAIQLLTNS